MVKEEMLTGCETYVGITEDETVCKTKT